MIRTKLKVRYTPCELEGERFHVAIDTQGDLVAKAKTPFELGKMLAGRAGLVLTEGYVPLDAQIFISGSSFSPVPNTEITSMERRFVETGLYAVGAISYGSGSGMSSSFR